jgi:spore maturation protein CgeB
MRIFYAAPNTPHQTQLPTSKVWETNLYWPLVDLGHDLVVFDFDYREFIQNVDPAVPSQQSFIARNRPGFSEELLRQIRAAHSVRPIDLFFSYFYSAYVEPDAIREIRALGIITVNWYCNASYQFHLVSEIAPAYDYCLVPERFRLDDYRRAGANPIYCQEAANPTVYKPYDVPLEFDVTFVGQRYGDRPLYLRYLIDAGLDARVWGPRWIEPIAPRPWWRRVGGAIKRTLAGEPWLREATFPADRCGLPLSDEELVKMYSRSRISLGFSGVADGSGVRQVRLRDFEAPMSGAFYMVEYFEELTAFFEPDREIVCFNSPAELLDKVRYFLVHDRDRQRIRDAGLRRARTEHTWQKRFEAVFREIGMS